MAARRQGGGRSGYRGRRREGSKRMYLVGCKRCLAWSKSTNKRDMRGRLGGSVIGVYTTRINRLVAIEEARGLAR